MTYLVRIKLTKIHSWDLHSTKSLKPTPCTSFCMDATTSVGRRHLPGEQAQAAQQAPALLVPRTPCLLPCGPGPSRRRRRRSSLNPGPQQTQAVFQPWKWSGLLLLLPKSWFLGPFLTRVPPLPQGAHRHGNDALPASQARAANASGFHGCVR